MRPECRKYLYDSVSDEVVWAVLANDLPRLLTEVNALLGTDKS